MARVVWSDDALLQLVEIADYFAQFDPQASQRLVARLEMLGDSLEHFPNRGRPTLHGMRELATAPPYLLGYEVTGDAVTILYVRHGAQRPRD